MQLNQSSSSSISLGHPMVREGGPTAQAEPTAQCPEAGSSNMELPGGLSSVRRESPILHETNNVRQEGREETTRVDEGRTRIHLTEEELRLQRLRAERETLWKSMGKKQGVRIASLNIKGRRDGKKKDKWAALTTTIRKQRILVMAVQETHLDDVEADQMKTKYPKLIVESNGDSTRSGGIAFAINKDLIGNYAWNHTILIPGRFSRLRIMTNEENGLDIFNVYAPNNDVEKTDFYSQVYTILNGLNDVVEPILLGDFNFVEQSADRAPAHEDNEGLKEKFEKIRKEFKMIDGWREQNPLTYQYTFFQATPGSASRIDRIYINEGLFLYAYKFEILTSIMLSDHDIVYVEILKKGMPYIGKGMGRIGIDTIERESFRKKAKKELMWWQKEMERKQREDRPGIQAGWMEMKEQLKEIADADAKERNCEMRFRKNFIKQELIRKMHKLAKATTDNREKLMKETSELREGLAKCSLRDVERLQEKAKMRYRVHGEKCTKYFFGLNKKKFSRDVILGLIKEDQTTTTVTREMAKIATEYHEKLQAAPEMNEERQQAIQEMLDVTEKTLTDDQKEMLERRTSQDEVEDALAMVQNGTTPGIDGIPYEFYKSWPPPKDEEEAETEPDIAKMLHILYEDIEKRGLQVQSKGTKREREFTDGVMYLLYKKKDKRMIENYRPITLLNTDYKLYTKTIATKLGIVAPTLLSEDQAGFVPGRNLYDHTKTTHVVAEYCELVGYNGCIVSLDQEKAYDKIDHTYLWQILEKNGFPRAFIDRIKEMYKDTGKSVMVNGVLPRQYKVKRGVHQGDPMSCLLYNFAIEPLAESLRRSNLRGIEVEGMTRKLLVTLFADDTLVYLRKDDDFKILEEILARFCMASTAKFNLDKTEYLPIGEKDFRKEVVENRKVGNNRIPPGVRIIKDGDAMRTLGAWVGNNADTTKQWETIVKNQEKIIDIWKGNHLSYQGKALVLKALVQSKAIFLATVNGMPRTVENTITKMYKDFMWDDKPRGHMVWKQIITQRKEGGLEVPDVKSRLQAIQLMWLKKWLETGNKRPMWALIVDAILARNIPKTPMTDEASRINWLLQSWQESDNKDTKISNEIKQMLRTARRYNVAVSAPKFSKGTKEAWPLWWHVEASQNYLWNKKAAKHIRKDHKVRTVGDLTVLQEELTRRPCTNACKQMAGKLMESLSDKVNPIMETPRKVREQKLELTPNRLGENANNRERTIFNPNVTADGSPLKEARVFGIRKGPKTRQKEKNTENAPRMRPAYRAEPDEIMEEQTVSIAVKVEKASTSEEKVAWAIWFEDEDQRNRATRMRPGPLARRKAMVTAATVAADVDRRSDLIIKTGSAELVWMMNQEHIRQEDRDWNDNPMRKEWRALLNVLRQRTGRTVIELDKDKSEGMLKAQEMAKKALDDIDIEQPEHRVADEFDIEGIRLRVMTQKLAYSKTSKANSEKAGGIKTVQNMKRAQDALEDMSGIRPLERQIWMGTKRISQPRVADFIWKLLHGRIKCGSWFKNVPQWEDKQYCTCGQVEEMEHILFECPDNYAEDLWNTINGIWEKMTDVPFTRPDFGIIMGIGSVTIRKGRAEDMSLTKVYKALILSAAWIIWKNRNERVFNNVEVTKAMQIVRWRNDIENTIRIEYDAVSLTPFRNRAPKYKQFERKWALGKVLCELGEGENERTMVIRLRGHLGEEEE